MPELHWQGKDAVLNYHETVPVRSLVVDAQNSHAKGVENWQPNLDDNLIITGDNLHAMKALLPKYAGKVDVIYIDPPYNTGNEKWVYNDNVNSPQLKAWLGEVVGKEGEDAQRHDKWLCMMYPRLQLMKLLLKMGGVIFVSIDDNEVHHLKALMDEVFGESNFIANYIWKARAGKDHTAKHVSNNHEHILFYTNDPQSLDTAKDVRVKNSGKYKDEIGEYDREQVRQWGTNDRRIDRPSMFYPVLAPDGSEIFPIKENGEEGCWRVSQERLKQAIEENDIDFVFDEAKSQWRIYAKKRAGKKSKTAFNSIIEDCGTSATGTGDIKKLFGYKVFDTVKPLDLVKHLITISNAKNGIVLDAFAGSGTTGHAVKQLNENEANLRYLLISLDEAVQETNHAYEEGFKTVDEITRERMRRVIDGVPTAKDEQLKEGLGGSFTAVKLGEVIDPLKILSGESLPTREDLAAYLFYTIELQSLNSVPHEPRTGFIGESENRCYYLHYQPNKEWLLSNEASLTRSQLQEIADHANAKNKTPFVLAPAFFVAKEDMPKGMIAHHLPYDIQRFFFSDDEDSTTTSTMGEE